MNTVYYGSSAMKQYANECGTNTAASDKCRVYLVCIHTANPLWCALERAVTHIETFHHNAAPFSSEQSLVLGPVLALSEYLLDVSVFGVFEDVRRGTVS